MSKKLKEWTVKELKDEAKGYHELIYRIGCYGCKDLINLDNIMAELDRRGVKVSQKLLFY